MTPIPKYSGPVPNLKWLLDFVRLDLDTLRPGALLDLRHDVILFTVGIGASFQLSEDEPSPTLLRQLQLDLRSGLHSLFVDGMRWELPEAPSEWALEPPLPPAPNLKAGAREPQLTFGLQPFRGAVLARAVHAIRERWADIRPCPHCESFFLKVRRQKFCSPECRWAAFAPTRQKRDYSGEYRHRRRQAKRATEREKAQAAGRRGSRKAKI